MPLLSKASNVVQNLFFLYDVDFFGGTNQVYRQDLLIFVRNPAFPPELLGQIGFRAALSLSLSLLSSLSPSPSPSLSRYLSLPRRRSRSR